MNWGKFTADFAKHKTHLFRVFPYVSIIITVSNFIMIMYLVILQDGNWWIVLLLPFTLIAFGMMWYFDKRALYRAERSYFFVNTPQFVQMQEDIKEVLERLEHLESLKITKYK